MNRFCLDDLREWVRDMDERNGYVIVREDGSIIDPPILPGDDDVWEKALDNFVG